MYIWKNLIFNKSTQSRSMMSVPDLRWDLEATPGGNAADVRGRCSIFVNVRTKFL